MTLGSTSLLAAGDGRESADSQAPAIAFLSDPATFGLSNARVDRIDTHAASVFLAGDRAYKIKRAVRYPYLDFSTVEQRAEACERELSLNRRSAPNLYLETRPIVRDETGTLRFDGRGDVVEWVLVMRRFDQDCLFDRMAQENKLNDQMMVELTEEILNFHAGLEPITEKGVSGGESGRVAEIFEDVVTELAKRADLYPKDSLQSFDRAWQIRIAALKGQLDGRRTGGKVRWCHGDLHLGNICLYDGRPTLFDCLEFSEDMATIDVLYDLAFLLMDLEHRGLLPLANLVLNRYLRDAEDLEGLALLPLYLSARAAIRAMVSASAEPAQYDAARRAALRRNGRRYFEQARGVLRPSSARLVAVGGLSGSGKTTLARELAPEIGPSPGAVHICSDLLRKQIMGVDALERLPVEAYAPDMHARVYDEMLNRARRVLAAGHGVVLDGVHGQADSRMAAARLAAEAGVPFVGLWLTAPDETLIDRVVARRNDVSDATADVVRRQLEEDAGIITWHRLPSGGALSQVLETARVIAKAGSAGPGSRDQVTGDG